MSVETPLNRAPIAERFGGQSRILASRMAFMPSPLRLK